jgi:phenylpropionate dioxygenase-like ring-hydroxylating dioxygenase large terminal subunit
MAVPGFPHPRYPNGWFQVAYSDELEEGAAQTLRYFGRDLALSRDAGVARVLEGAAPWPCVERNAMVMVWHHAEGAPPSWEVPAVEEHGSDDWTAYERRRWRIRTHNQEMAENAVDRAHFLYVHGTAEMPSTRAEVHEQVLHVISSTKMTTPMGKVAGSVESISHGFGFSTTRFRGIVETLLVTSVTPIDEDDVDVRFAFTVRKLPHKDVTKTVGRAFIAEIERQLEQDIPIWENKRYVHPPLLCDGDGPIGLFRKWARQFYGG